MSDRYLGIEEPLEPLENRSLLKYNLIIEEFGGYDLFQQLLKKLKLIADKHHTGISEVAIRYVMQKPSVAGVIVGARNTLHLKGLKKLDSLVLDDEDVLLIDGIISSARGPIGPVYGLERNREGKHGSIMRYNLSKP